MIKQFDHYRIITNGKKYRIEGQYTPSEFKEPEWIQLSGGFYGIDSYGYLSNLGGIYEFDSEEEAIEFIRKQYGEFGIERLKQSDRWWPV